MSIAAKPESTTVPEVTETYARSLTDNSVLFIDRDGSWKVGTFGQTITTYKNVTFGATTKINDLTYDVTALAAGRGTNGGYKLYASANENERIMFEIDVKADGQATGARRMTNKEIWDTETRLNTDLNGNGGIGAVNVLVNDSSENLMADANGDLFIQTEKGKAIALTLDGQLLNIRDVGDLEFADVSFEDNGSIAAYLYSEDGDLYYQAFDAAGRADGDLLLISNFTGQSAGDRGILSLGSDTGRARTLNTAGQNAEAKTGQDLNRQSDTPLTEGWTSMLKTTAVKEFIEKATANGAKLDHAGVVSLMNMAITAAGASATDKVNQAVIDDLRAIAARGKALFGAKDTTGGDTSYLAYVFDKVANDSDANAYFTGGTGTKQNLGNLSSDSTVAQLGLLRDKWLLGKDMPNPATEGDTANASAKAATGSYKSFDAALFIDGTQYQDVNQGSAGTCYLLATMATVAHNQGTTIQQAFVANTMLEGAGRTFGVRFFGLDGSVHWVTVNDQLVVLNAADTNSAYSKVMGVNSKGVVAPELWAPLLEKAYAQFNELKLNKREKAENAMFAIEGGNAEITVFLTNRNSLAYTDNASDVVGGINGINRMQVMKPEGKTALEAYTEALNKGSTMWVGSGVDVKDGDIIMIKSGHAHMVIDADPADPKNTSVIFYNPWGTAPQDAPYRSPFMYDLAKLVGVKGIDLFIDVPTGPTGG